MRVEGFLFWKHIFILFCWSFINPLIYYKLLNLVLKLMCFLFMNLVHIIIDKKLRDLFASFIYLKSIEVVITLSVKHLLSNRVNII
jgi:hypothetical protein